MDTEGFSLTERELVIGIDFGTTYSGVAWAETKRPDNHSVIESWPARIGTSEGMSSIKVPTELRYTSKGTEWGFQIPSLADRHQWFKLALSSNNPINNGSDKAKTSEQLTTDYLTELYKHVMYTLEQKLGAAILRTVPLSFCLTVPAIWSELAKEKTLKACKNAGITSESDIMIVSEPEAAAIYALHGLDPHGLQTGDTFVLCDAGGGTVDLISYTITKLRPTLQVKEAAQGTGGLCGSAFLNRRFGEFLKKRLGGEEGWDDEILAEAMERFDTVVKKQYTPASANEDGYTIPVSGLANNPKLGIRRGRYLLPARDLEGIFEPVVTEIIDLVKGQIKSTDSKPKAVLLVGGFGQNNYLKQRLRSSLKGVEVLQPPNAWAAIMRGAVMMGLSRRSPTLTSVNVTSRSARKHYGIELNVRYKERQHNAARKYWCDRERCWKVRAMSWFVCRGDTVEEGKPRNIDFVWDHAVEDGLPKLNRLTIFADAERNDPPVHKLDSTKKLVELEAHLDHLTESELKPTITRFPDGKDYYHIQVNIEATFLSASTKYVLCCFGNKYDTVTAEYV